MARLHFCKPDHRVHDHDNINMKEKQFKLIHLFKGDGCGLKIIVVTEFIIISYHVRDIIFTLNVIIADNIAIMNERCESESVANLNLKRSGS